MIDAYPSSPTQAGLRLAGKLTSSTMILAGAETTTGPLLSIGLSEGNIERLKNGFPIKIDRSHTPGMPRPQHIIIDYGVTESAIEWRLFKAGLIDSTTKRNTDPKAEALNELLNNNGNILIGTVGLPRSGKSTWSKKQAYPVVNPDSIRLALHGQQFAAEAEPYVWAIAKTMVKSLFLAGHKIVILDATNITETRRREWCSKLDWTTAWKVFSTPPAECIERAKASKREDLIPVIERMHAQYQPIAANEIFWP